MAVDAIVEFPAQHLLVGHSLRPQQVPVVDLPEQRQLPQVVPVVGTFEDEAVAARQSCAP
jgi:hypothetical protein